MQIVDLLEPIHARGLVYSNLCPEDVLLVSKDLHRMCLPSLFHCIGESIKCPGIAEKDPQFLPSFETRTRNSEFLSPEQVGVGRKLLDIGSAHNGKTDEKSSEVQEFISNAKRQITA